MFTSFLYMFRVTMCPSSGETTIYATLVICHSVWMMMMMMMKYQVSC